MKQIILFFGLLLLWTSCKKDSNKQKEILLGGVITNGAANTRIHYAADNKMDRFESYNGNALTAYLTVQYDASGYISEISSKIMPGDIPAVRILMLCDGQGRVTNATNYDLLGPVPNTPVSVAVYTYNAEARLSKVVRKDDKNKLLSSISFLYFPDGNLKEMQTYKEADNKLWLSEKTIYSVPSGFYPKGVDQLRTILGPDFTASLFSESIQIYSYDQNGGTLTHKSRLMSGREFNEDGSLKKQVETFTSIKPPQPDVVSNKGYEYVLQ